MQTSKPRTGYVQLLDNSSVGNFTANDDAFCSASISYRLAHDTARSLEARWQYVRAADVLARALAAEAQRVNQRTMRGLDLSKEPHAFQAIYQAMLLQRGQMAGVRAPLLQRQSCLPSVVVEWLEQLATLCSRCFPKWTVQQVCVIAILLVEGPCPPAWGHSSWRKVK